MKEVFDNYIQHSFDEPQQADFKIAQFAYNYRSHFPGKSKKALDIGIGRGEMLTCMKNWGMDYEGVDISPSTVNFCQKLGLNCVTTSDTAAWLQERTAVYDIITALDVIEHIPREDLIAFLQTVNTSLKPNGKAVFQVPNLQSPEGYLHHFNDITHASGFVEHSLHQVLLAADFKNIKYFGFEELIENTPRTLIRKVLRWFYWRLIRTCRYINCNPNPRLLHPVFFCIAEKSDR